MITSIIPTQPQNQQFRVSLNAVTYVFKLVYRADTWYADISDANGNPILAGVPLVTGADLLAQYGYLGIGGKLQTASSGINPDATPTYSGLGSISQLYFTV